MTSNGGQLLLIFAGSDARTIAQLTAASDLDPAEMLRQLGRLVEQGFVLAAAPSGDVAVYRLNPKGTRTETGDPQQRILLIEDDLAVQELMTLLLEDQGYGVVVTRTPADAENLLREVAFDLVITDGFSQTPATLLASAAQVLTAAGVTPVVLFTAHRVELDDARAAGFRDLLAKPFDLETLERQVWALLQ